MLVSAKLIYLNIIYTYLLTAPSDNLEIDQIMAKLEQDNKFLADLEKQRKAAKVLNTNITETTSASSTSSTSTNGHSDTNSSSTPSSNNHSPTSLPRFVYIIFGIRRIILSTTYMYFCSLVLT